MYSVYARTNDQRMVTHIFSDMFEKPKPSDILIKSGDGEDCIHVFCERGGVNLYTYDNLLQYKIENGEMIKRSEKELEEEREKIFINNKDVIGNIKNLETENKENIVEAINEVNVNNDNLFSDLLNSGLLSECIHDTGIRGDFTFDDLIHRKEVTFFTNWTDHTNFPELFGSGVFMPCGDNRCNNIIYVTSPLPIHTHFPRKIFVGHVFTDRPNEIITEGLTESSIVWKEIMTNDEVSNPNLLINSNFRINQRGLNKYQGNNIYSVDRWIIWNAVLSTCNNGINIVLDNPSSSYYELRQYIEIDFNYISGKTLVASLCIDGMIYFRIYELPSRLNELFVSDKILFDNFYLRLEIRPDHNNILCFQIYNHGTQSHIINWAKLEIGSVVTPFALPDKVTELLKCKRYYQKIGAFPQASLMLNMLSCTSGTPKQYLTFNGEMDCEMRTIPTIELYGTPNSDGDTGYSVTNVDGSSPDRTRAWSYSAFCKTNKTFGITVYNEESENKRFDRTIFPMLNLTFYRNSGVKLDAEIYPE